MKAIVKHLALLTSLVVAMSVTSCINDDLADRQDLGAGKIAALEDQAAAIEASVADIEALQTALGEGRDAGLERSASALEDHVADLRAKVPFMDATMTTLALQKKLAEAVGAVLASDSNGDLAKHAATLEKGVKTWLGKHLTAYYPAALAQARTASEIASLDLKTRKLSVEAILSDVEAGLSAYEDVEGLSALAEKVNGNCETAASLAAELSALTEEVEAEYTKAVETVVSDPENFDAPAIKQFNAGVQTKAGEADNTLAGLISRVEACEAQLAEIKTRLAALESKVDDLEELLGMIQSVTFMSEYSEEKAVAYYNLGAESRQDGKKKRNPEGTVDLKYIVRPATAAQALTTDNLWDKEVKVFGYYAQAITKAAPETFNFDITDVTADESGNGIVTVTVSAASLNEAFYFKETGAKLALSIATGKTDLTSKFVEIVPKDKSGTVYVEGIELSAKSIEIDHGAKADLDAYITPDNVTVGGVTWTTSNANVVNVTENGVIEGVSVGNATITATTKGTNEWGNTILAQCNVKVNPAIRLSGPSYVEKGGNITIRIESPDYIDPESVTWSSNASTIVTITTDADGNARVNGNAVHFDISDNGSKAYIPITITCEIEDGNKTELQHEIRVIAIQPKGVVIDGMSADQTTLTLKKGQEHTFNASVQPAEVDMTLFRFRYQSNNTEVVNVPDISSGKVVANAIGSATVSVKVTDQGKFNYFYPARNEFVRYVDVNVEPYWVTGITLPSTWEMKPGDEGSITPVFTSDGGNNVQPTDMTLAWTSDDPSVVEVDSATGKMTAKSVGTAQITATSTSVPSGSNPVSASCVVAVKMAGADAPKVGDYYYSDGTWSTELDSGKTVIGVVFSTMNATGGDSKLLEQHKDCTNGLVVSVKEISSIFGANCGFQEVMHGWLSSNYGAANYTTFRDFSGNISTNAVANGYTATLGLKGYKQYRGEADCCQIVSVLNDASLPAAPTEKPNSGWYIPSYKEMQLLCAEKVGVNSAINNVGGNQIGEGKYWISSLYAIEARKGGVIQGYTYYFDSYAYPFDMTTSTWYETENGTYGPIGTKYPVRVVLAF